MSRHWNDFLQFRNAYGLAISAAMGSIFYGWDIGLIGGVLSLRSFQVYFGLNTKTASQRADLNGNIVAVLQAGCFFGGLSTVYLSNRFGRKPSLLASGVVYMIGSVIQCIAGLGSSQAVALSVLYFSRFLGGWGVGMVSALVPSYVSECTPKSIRGRCTGIIQLAINVGTMLGFWVNYSASKDIAPGDLQWRIPFVMQMVPGVLFIIAMIFQPESPRWLVEHGKEEEAARALAFVNGSSPQDKDVLQTIEDIRFDFTGNKKLPLLKQFLSMGESTDIALRCFIPSLVMFFHQWTGTNAINYFSPQIFSSLGIKGSNNELFATGIYGVAKVVSVGLALMFAVESLGRKNCLIIGGIGQGLTMIWIGGYSAIHKSSGVDAASYISIVAVYLYGVFYGIGWGPLHWVVPGEVAPNHLRTASISIAIGVSWLFAFVVSKLTPIMLNNITYGTFLIFGFCCIAMTLWVYFLLPETKGYALEDIKYLFEKDMVLRALEDAPGGHIFIGTRRSTPVEELRSAAEKNTAEPTHRKIRVVGSPEA